MRAYTAELGWHDTEDVDLWRLSHHYGGTAVNGTVYRFWDMSEVRRANEDRGHYFFEPATLRFFRSRIGSTLYGGRFFVTSEQHVSPMFGADPRRYTVREAMPDGSIDTVGDFQAYADRRQAIAEIRRLLERTETA